MPHIKELKIKKSGFKLRPEVTLEIDFAPEEVGKTFFVRIDYLLSENTIQEPVITKGIFFEGNTRPNKENFKDIFRKNDQIESHSGFKKVHFEVTINPIFVSPKHLIS